MRNPLSRFSWFVVVLAGVAVQCVSAGMIGITTTVSASVKDNTVQVDVLVTNTGDESGYNLQAKMSLFGKEDASKKVPNFPPGRPIRFAMTMPINDLKPGTYPVIVRVFCTDANQYPFSALASHSFTKGSGGGPVEIVGEMKSLSLAKKDNLDVSLKNMGDTEIRASVHLITPRELSVDNAETKVLLPPRAEQNVRFSVVNFSAKPASIYPLIATIEYDDKGVHQTAIALGTATITEAKKVLGVNYYVLGVVLIVLVGVFIAFERFRK